MEAAMEEDLQNNDGGARVRSPSPMINSAERPGKAHRVSIATPLQACPAFPSLVLNGVGGDGGGGGSSGGGGEPSNADIMKQLTFMMSTMSTKDDINTL